MAPTIVNTEEAAGGNRAEREETTYASAVRPSPRRSKWNKRNKTQADRDEEEAKNEGGEMSAWGEVQMKKKRKRGVEKGGVKSLAQQARPRRN